LVFYFNLGERVGAERVAVWLSVCFVLNPLIFPFYTLLAGAGMLRERDRIAGQL